MPLHDFYGSHQASIHPLTTAYPTIHTPQDLFNALLRLWTADTCAPRMREKWNVANPTLGQCSITAFLAQDIFGGKVYGILRPGGNYHCYNVVENCVFDLTSEQFGDEILSYEDNPEQFRDVHFAKDEKRRRYEDLCEKLKVYCRRKRMELTTERLLLRPWRESDAADLFECAKDPAVGPIAGWPVHQSIEDSLFVIQNVFNGSECYAVCLKEDGRAIGCIELMMREKSALTDREDECELGYWIGQAFWGRGLIPEAAKRLIRHGFEDLGMRKIWCGYYDGNTKSSRVQEKMGFQYHHTMENVPVPLLAETRTEHITCLTRERWQGWND